jgi:hypothetical protein
VSVRKTESRLPDGFQASDLGESVTAPNGRSALVSLLSAPLTAGRENAYVVYVTDPAMAGGIATFEWTFSESSGAPVIQTSENGEIAYTPATTGRLGVLVRMLDGGSAELGRLGLDQDVVRPDPGVEAMVEGARNEPGPGAGNPDVARELVNDLDPYFRGIAPSAPETGDAFERFVLAMLTDGALQRTPAERKQDLDQLAAALNGETDDLAAAATRGSGVCAIRLAILAMITPRTAADPTPMLPWTELPDVPPQRAVADEDLREALAALDGDRLVDLFNLVRCPKSNIAACGRLIEALRDRYFPGTPFEDVLTGLSAVRAVWIARHLREGPLQRA